MMHRLIDLLYRIGVGVLVCSSLYRLFFKILPALFASKIGADGQQVVTVGVVVVIVVGPLFSLWLGSRLLRSVTTEVDDKAADPETVTAAEV